MASPISYLQNFLVLAATFQFCISREMYGIPPNIIPVLYENYVANPPQSLRA
jgi:hypothetical protein